MRLKIRQILLPLDYEDKDIKTAVAPKLGCNEYKISFIKILRRSIDARKRREAPVFSVTAEIEIKETDGFLIPDDVGSEVIKEETAPVESSFRKTIKKPNNPLLL